MPAQSKHETAVRAELKAALEELDGARERARIVEQAVSLAEVRVDILQTVIMRAERTEPEMEADTDMIEQARNAVANLMRAERAEGSEEGA